MEILPLEASSYTREGSRLVPNAIGPGENFVRPQAGLGPGSAARRRVRMRRISAGRSTR